jgi:hypothetical protein
MDAVAPMTEAASVGLEEMDLMALRLRRRSRSRPDAKSGRPFHDITQAERAAMTDLAHTLRQLAAELPRESRLAIEFDEIARSIDVAGVLGTWRLGMMVRECADDTAPAADVIAVRRGGASDNR